MQKPLKDRGSNCEILSRTLLFDQMTHLWSIFNEIHQNNAINTLGNLSWKEEKKKERKYWENTLVVKVYEPSIRVSLSLKGRQVCGNKTLQRKAKKG